jgi:N-acetyl-anhydromuramyl-L-alanine amidase AmpD
MKGNKQIFSENKEDRIKGYKKLIKRNEGHYNPPQDIAKDIVEAMEAQGYEVELNEVLAYMKSSIAAFDRKFRCRTR